MKFRARFRWNIDQRCRWLSRSAMGWAATSDVSNVNHLVRQRGEGRHKGREAKTSKKREGTSKPLYVIRENQNHSNPLVDILNV